MARAVDAISILLLLASGVAFGFGIDAIARRSDLQALYWLAIGALALRSATDMLRPAPGSR
jgi:hypothetical protein